MQQRVIEMSQGPIWKDYRAKVVTSGEGEAVLHVPIKEEMTQFHGSVHGGVIATVSDMAMAAAVNSLVAEDEFTVTAELKVNYLRPATGSFLRANAKVIKRGKTLTHCQCEVFDENEKQVCFVVATFYMFTKE